MERLNKEGLAYYHSLIKGMLNGASISSEFPTKGDYRIDSGDSHGVDGDVLIIPSYAGDVRTKTLKLHSVFNLSKRPKILTFE